MDIVKVVGIVDVRVKIIKGRLNFLNKVLVVFNG